MRLKPNLKLRRIGTRYMVVDVAEAVNLTNVFTLNATAAMLWQEAEGVEFTAVELAERLCAKYDVDMDVALRDVQRQIDEWQSYGLI